MKEGDVDQRLRATFEDEGKHGETMVGHRRTRRLFGELCKVGMEESQSQAFFATLIDDRGR